MQTPLEQRIRAIIEAPLNAMGYALVRLKVREGKSRNVLEIMAERTDDVPMSFDDCAAITHTASAQLDVEDPIPGAYDLEVSSPGLDRPLNNALDFKRFQGQEARVETMLPINGRKRFRGTITHIAGDDVTLALEEGGEQIIACAGIRSAKLVAEMPNNKKPATKKKKTA